MKMRKIIALLLALCFALSLCACSDDDDTGGIDTGDRGADGSWDNVDFGGSKLYVNLSAHQDHEVTFPAANIYTKGPDSGVTTDEVQKKVLARNKKVAEMLNIQVEYSLSVLKYNEVLDDIERYVRGAAEDAPDVYNNDLFGITRAIPQNYFWNVANPGNDKNGNPVKSYFDFTQDGWNYDFMKGCTFDQNKLYVLAGDYFIDMIRMAWVFYVNADMFNANAASLQFEDINEFYEYVESGIWDYDYLTYLCGKIWKDNGKTKNVADVEDERVGLAINHMTDWIFVGSSGVTTFYQDENGNPKMIDDYDTVYQMSEKLRTVMQAAGSESNPPSKLATGIYFQNEVLSSTEHFFNNHFLFAASVLGELESSAMRGVDFQKGLVPFPKWYEQMQDEYHTMVHDQTEIGVIFNSARSFGMASAFLQAINEESEDVRFEYYEKSLKFKYNEDPGIRSMIDLVYYSIDNPFSLHMTYLLTGYIDKGTLRGHWTGLDDAVLAGTVASDFEKYQEAYEYALAQMLQKFETLD